MFSVDKTVMLLIDVQGKLAQIMHDKDNLFQSLQVMIQSMQILGVPIIWMEQIPDKLGDTSKELADVIIDNKPIAKSSFSCCGEPKFMEAFKESGKTQVLLTGIESHICVFQTGYQLLNQGYQVQVVSDCVSSRTKENKDVGIQRIVQSGGRVSSVEMVLFELLGAAKGDKFKQIVKLIK